jgi:lysophospholipase L1-like esterase
MRRVTLLMPVLALVLAAGPVRAEFALTDGDRVMFFGPTAVWPASYGLQVETFVRVKYPNLKTRFWHWGPQVPGSIVLGAERLEDHLNAFHPTKVVLGFGLEHGETKPFDASRLAAFREQLAGLIERCQSAGAKVVLVTPHFPEIHRKQLLTNVKYDEVVGRYAQAIRELGTERKLAVIDWYTATLDYAREHPPDRSGKKGLTADGLHPTPLGNAIAAEALLEAWDAEPHAVAVHVHWDSLEATTTAGSIGATRKSDSVVALELKDFPLPWAIPGRRRADARDWADSPLCRFVFHVHKAPPGGVLTSTAGGKPTPWLEQMLEDGFDMSTIGPLVKAEPLTTLMQLVRRKNLRIGDIDEWTAKPFPEPEYAEANVKWTEAMVAEAEATAKVIARTPRTMHLTLDIALVKPPAKPQQ